MRVGSLAGIPIALVLASCAVQTDGEMRRDPEQTQAKLAVARCAGVLRAIEGKHAALDGQPRWARELGAYVLRDNGLALPAGLAGPFPLDRPDFYQRSWLSPINFDGFGPSIAFQTRGCRRDCVREAGQKQSVTFRLFGDDAASGLQVGKRHHVGFALRVSRDAPEGQPRLFQLSQGSPHAAVIAGRLRTEADGSMSLSLDVANEATGSHPAARRVEIGALRNFEKDVWYALVLSLFPGSTGARRSAGEPTVQLDVRAEHESTYSTALTYYGDWGYTPGNGCVHGGDCATAGPSEKLDFEFGIDREAERTALQVRFDNIKAATTWAAADPTYVCRWGS